MSRHETDRAIAFVIADLNPAWDAKGIAAVLGKLHDRDPVVAYIAALKAARRTDQRTPAVIAMDGPHWKDAPEQDRPTSLPPPVHVRDTCQTCRMPRAQHDRINSLTPEDAHDWRTR